VRFPQWNKDFLDNSSGRTSTHKSNDEAWSLLDKISENTDNWNLDKGKKSSWEYFFEGTSLEYEYTCVENLYYFILFFN
jgi:hypothetical protein